MLKSSLRFFLLVFLASASFLANAQTHFGSPYSRYGIGDLFTQSNNVGFAMAGTSLAIRNPLAVNYVNPASYTVYDTLSFIFEGGVSSKAITLKTNGLSQSSNYATLSHLLFGFPVTKWWKTSLGLVPFSQVGYNISETFMAENIGKTERQYEGTGGINQFYWGNGFRLTKNLSIGFNAAYLFGTLNKTRSINYPDSIFIRSYRVVNSSTYGDFMFTYGLQYYTKISKNLHFGAGAVFSNSTSINVNDQILSETFSMGSSGVVYIKDTIENKPSVKGQVVLPMSYGVGLMLMNVEQWLVAADFRHQNWSDYEYFGIKDSLKNSYQASVGFQFTPNATSLTSYAQRINYRLGFRYGKTYLQLRENQLSEYAFSAGIGLPLNKTRSTLNLGIEFGKRGTTDKNLIQENFFKINLGVSVSELWFYRRKFE